MKQTDLVVTGAQIIVARSTFLLQNHTNFVGWDSSVGISTRYGLDLAVRGSNPG
jgi:hypothetical protein